ncbi:MAG: ORF6N domain-containing protein [Prevotellaceae bacterium]|jgi:hypothetical protein|nr:ORF6N domain-containing protein [Prevotellaceae bacterium]
MKNLIVKFSNVGDKIFTLRGEKVILDSDVAELYEVETKRVNEAIKNNPDKFPKGYVLQLSKQEWYDRRKILLSTKSGDSENYGQPVENFDRLGHRKHSSVLPKAFTEKGLYMLATILKSPAATQTTIAIVETFAKIRELSRTVAALAESPEEFKQKTLMQKGGDIIADILDSDLKVTGTETSIELNFALLKIKHTIKQEKNKSQ